MLGSQHCRKQSPGVHGRHAAFVMHPGCEMHGGRPVVAAGSQPASLKARREPQRGLQAQPRRKRSEHIDRAGASIHPESSAQSQKAIGIFETT